MYTAPLIRVWSWEFTITTLGLISGITSCLFGSRLQLKSVAMAFPQWATTEGRKAIHSRHRRDPWKKQVRSPHKKTFCPYITLHILSRMHCETYLFLCFQMNQMLRRWHLRVKLIPHCVRQMHTSVVVQKRTWYSFCPLTTFSLSFSYWSSAGCPVPTKVWNLF